MIKIDKDRIMFSKIQSLCESISKSWTPRSKFFPSQEKKLQSFLWVIVRWNIWCPIKRNQTLENQNRNEL